MSIGERIKAARELRGMSAEDLAEELGAFVAEIKTYEDEGESPDLNTLICLCDVLNVTADWLLGRTDEEISVPSCRVGDVEFDNLREVTSTDIDETWREPERFTNSAPSGELWKPNSPEEVGERARAAGEDFKKLFGLDETNANAPGLKEVNHGD